MKSTDSKILIKFKDLKFEIIIIFKYFKQNNNFGTFLYDNFNERLDRQGPAAQSGACQNGTEENGEAGGILGKITAGIHAVSETINDIVRPKLKNTL